MMKDSYEIDIGFIITKAPLESSLGSGFLDLAQKAINDGKTVGLFLISDGVWFAKKHQKNRSFKILDTLIKKGASVTISKENLEAAGIKDHELINGVIVSDKPYTDLVDLVMEKWRQVMTI